MIILNSCSINGISCLKAEIWSTGTRHSSPSVAGEIGFHVEGSPFGNIRIEGMGEGSEEITDLAIKLLDAIESCAANAVGSVESEAPTIPTPQGILDKDV